MDASARPARAQVVRKLVEHVSELHGQYTHLVQSVQGVHAHQAAQEDKLAHIIAVQQEHGAKLDQVLALLQHLTGSR